MTPGVSARLVRSFLRYLRERLGDGAYEAVLRDAPLGTPPEHGWIEIDRWVDTLQRFESRHGELATWRLLRETTRVTMAMAVGKGWSAFMPEATHDSLLARAGTFWSMSYNTGSLAVVHRGARSVKLAVDGWPSPPAPVGASVAEACAVFLVRLGEREGRVSDRVVDGRLEIEGHW
jgi:hypothetical protein